MRTLRLQGYVCSVSATDTPLCVGWLQGLPGDDELLPPQVEESPAYPIGRITIHCTAARWVCARHAEGTQGCSRLPAFLFVCSACWHPWGLQALGMVAALPPAGPLFKPSSLCAGRSYDIKGLREQLEQGGYM